jgi:hypothetical protein
MDEQRLHAIEQRWDEIEAELADIYAVKVTPSGDPAKREAELLEEMDGLEFELGE